MSTEIDTVNTAGDDADSADVGATKDCDHDWEFCDDSFDHEFGTETVHYFTCTICGQTRDVGPSDYVDDDDFTEPENTTDTFY
jgi:hypothetical protein